MSDQKSGKPLLTVNDLRVSFSSATAISKAVDGVTFTIGHGETVGLVGESGCGKSITALSLLRLLPQNAVVSRESSIEFDGLDVLSLEENAIRDLRGNRISMVFQESMSALNPLRSVGAQIVESVVTHSLSSRDEAWDITIEILKRVGISDPYLRARQYPHELSGGMRQRVMMAMALVMKPSLLIADEPTTALDVTIQAQILDLLRDLRASMGMAVLLITHDLGVVAETASRVLVMYAGEIVEEAPVHELFSFPSHPYTQGLLSSVPVIGPSAARLNTIPGSVPPASEWLGGCRFRDRCPFAWERCSTDKPALLQTGPAHRARCHLVQEPERRV